VNKRFDRIDYHPHFFKRMRERKVRFEQIERCVQAPHREKPSKTHANNVQAEYDTDLTTLIVWYQVISAGHIEVKSFVRRKRT
jgi:hypothetical protein